MGKKLKKSKSTKALTGLIKTLKSHSEEYESDFSITFIGYKATGASFTYEGNKYDFGRTEYYSVGKISSIIE